MTSAPGKAVILCVEDDTRMLDTFESQLNRAFPNYAVAPAAGGMDARRLLKSFKEDGVDLAMVITDQLLGDTTGTELLTRIAAVYPNAARVIITGHAAVESAIEGVRLGVDDYLEKPVDEKGLRRALRPLLDRHRLRAEQTAMRHTAREALRRMSALLELTFRDMEPPLARLFSGGSIDPADREALERAQGRLNMLWTILRDEGLGRDASPEYFSAHELITEAQQVWHRTDSQGLMSEDIPAAVTVVKPERLALFADKSLSRIALEQVLHNAWRYGDAGAPVVIVGRGPGATLQGDTTPPPSPAVSAQLRAGRGVISVTSPGMLTPRDHQRIHRALNPGQLDGPLPGAGLIVARTLLEICAGNLSFEGIPGQDGATFHLALPAAGSE